MMKLSDAIRLGAMLKPQAFGDYTDGRGTCAWGAANEAIGVAADDDGDLTGPWLALCCADVSCPSCGGRYGSIDPGGDGCPRVATLIAHLNDHHRWTREQIADWVATIEAQQEQATPAEVEAVTV